MVTYSKINCERCEQPIKSGRVQKIITNTKFGQDPKILYYCKHCFTAVISEI